MDSSEPTKGTKRAGGAGAATRKDILRIVACGAVGDGKATLLGQLLSDRSIVSDDRRARRDTETSAAPEQGIAVDLAYRSFETGKRRFVLADVPAGSAQIRDIAAGASQADLALVVVDVRQGVGPETRRQASVLQVMGIRHLVVAANKMDLVEWDEIRFREVERAYTALAAAMGIERVTVIPVSAQHGDNVAARSAAMGWYQGPTLLAHLEAVDVAHGDPITTADDAPVVSADQLQATLVWLGNEKLVPERRHSIRFNTAATTGKIMTVKYRFDIDTAAHLSTRTLDRNEIGVVTLALDRELPIHSYGDNRQTGFFVVIDRHTDATLGVGIVQFPLRRATNVKWHALAVDKSVRAAKKAQRPRCFWFTGLSGSGKSTIANMMDRRLTAVDRHTYLLYGDNVRHGLNQDLGFTETDRVENIRRMAEVAKLMVDAGLIVLVCAISPYRQDREMARRLFEAGEFIEVFVDTPLAECERRDPKGLYRKARQGLIPNFTGISAPYERPEKPEFHLDGTWAVEDLVEQIFAQIEA